MKLKRFQGVRVRGYMNFDISFDSNLTFLIGINGTGKTTILKLLSGLLTPSYLELSQIDFSEIILTCERVSGTKQSYVYISCSKKGNTFALSYYEPYVSPKKITDSFTFSENNFFEREFGRDPIEFEKINHETYRFENTNVVNKIKSLRTPLFLGLNRMVRDSKFMPFDRDIMFNRRRNVDWEFSADTVDSALSEIEDMFHDHVRKNAQSQYELSEMFRKKVFSESFKVEEHTVIPNIEYNIELEKLEDRREKLNDAIEKLDVKDLSKQFSEYFDSIKKTLLVLSNTNALYKDNNNNTNTNPEYIKALLKWLVNCSQLEKIDNIIRYANTYSENIQKLKEPIVRFVESVNLFFKESGKEIDVDNKGEIKVKIKNSKRKPNTIYELSSGEKQLIIMLAHISFYKKNKNTSIFIIDEPELSLHISWQEIFVDALLKASPDTQFILATHAPAIISHISRRKNCIDLTKMN